MAQRVEVLLIDDIDGGAASETIRFSIDGDEYEMDVNAANARALRDAVEPFRAYARKVKRQAGRTRQARVASTGPSTEELRAWARANGYTVADRGRISEELRAVYTAAQRSGGAGSPELAANIEARVNLGQDRVEGEAGGSAWSPVEFRHADAGV